MITKEQLVPVAYHIPNGKILIASSESGKWAVDDFSDNNALNLSKNGQWLNWLDIDDGYEFDTLDDALEALNKALTPVLTGNIDVIGDGVS